MNKKKTQGQVRWLRRWRKALTAKIVRLSLTQAGREPTPIVILGPLIGCYDATFAPFHNKFKNVIYKENIAIKIKMVYFQNNKVI